MTENLTSYKLPSPTDHKCFSESSVLICVTLPLIPLSISPTQLPSQKTCALILNPFSYSFSSTSKLTDGLSILVEVFTFLT